MYPPTGPSHLNVPLPDASALAPEEPNGLERALPLITSLFGLGTALGGSPRGGAAFVHGAHQTLQARQQERQAQAKEAQRQAEVQQRLQIAEQIRQQEMEQQRQLGIQKLITGTHESLKGVTDRDQYEQVISFAENMGAQQYGLRPNAIRGMVPYRAPNAKKNLYDAVDKYLKNPANKEALDQGLSSKVSIQVDTDGDGVPDRPVALSQAIQESGYPVFLDAESGKPLMTGKPVKPENVEPFDLTYRGMVDRFKTEKGREPTDAEKGQMAVGAQRALDKPPAAGGADGGLKDYQKFTAGEKLADKWTKTSAPLKEMKRQFGLMQSGLQRFKQGDRLGGSQAVLVTFQKMLDPNSVVRESEYARSAAGLSLISRIEGAVQKLQSGGAGVPVEDLSAMVQTAQQFLQSMQSYTDGQRKRIGSTANQYGIDPSLVFDDIVPDAPSGAPTAAASITVTAPDGKRYTFATQAQADAFKRAAGIK